MLSALAVGRGRPRAEIPLGLRSSREVHFRSSGWNIATLQHFCMSERRFVLIEACSHSLMRRTCSDRLAQKLAAEPCAENLLREKCALNNLRIELAQRTCSENLLREPAQRTCAKKLVQRTLLSKLATILFYFAEELARTTCVESMLREACSEKLAQRTREQNQIMLLLRCEDMLSHFTRSALLSGHPSSILSGCRRG